MSDETRCGGYETGCSDIFHGERCLKFAESKRQLSAAIELLTGPRSFLAARSGKAPVDEGERFRSAARRRRFGKKSAKR